MKLSSDEKMAAAGNDVRRCSEFRGVRADAVWFVCPDRNTAFNITRLWESLEVDIDSMNMTYAYMNAKMEILNNGKRTQLEIDPRRIDHMPLIIKVLIDLMFIMTNC